MLPPLDRPLVRTPRKIYQNGSIQMKTVFIMHGTYSSLDLNDVHYLKRFHGNHPSGKRNKQMSQKPKIRLQKTPNSSSVIDLDPAIHDHSLTHSHSTTPIISLLTLPPTLPHFPPPPPSQRRSQKSRTRTMRNCLWSPCSLCGQMTTMPVRGVGGVATRAWNEVGRLGEEGLLGRLKLFMRVGQFMIWGLMYWSWWRRR